MTSRASPRQILALASCRAGQPFGGHAAHISAPARPPESYGRVRLEAALIKNSPLPEPISSSTGWSLPNSSGQTIGAGSSGGVGSIR